MRLVLTIVSPQTRLSTDIVLEADPETPVGEIAAELGRFAGVPAAPDSGSPLGSRVPPRVPRFSPHRVPPARANRPGASPPRVPLPRAPLPRAPRPRALPRMPQLPQFRIPQPRVPLQDTRGALALSSPLVSVDPDAVTLYVEGQRIAPHITLADSPIVDGTVISLGGPAGRSTTETSGLVEIRIVAGPGTGAIYRLAAGEAGIGSGQKVTVKLPSRSVPPQAASLTVDNRGGCRVTAHEEATVLLDRVPVTGSAQWRPGQQLAVGPAVLELVPYRAPDAARTRSADGSGIGFTRPPRLLPARQAVTFILPAPPMAAVRWPAAIVMAVLPLIAGAVMASLLHQAGLMAMAGLSPVPLIGSAVSGRRRGHLSPAACRARYGEARSRIEQEAASALAAERADRCEQFPDPAALLSIASGPRPRLWERRRTDPDYLTLRVGTADLPSAVQVIDLVRHEHRRTVTWPLPDAPVTIPLTERRVVGLVGQGDSGRAVGRWLVAQAAVLHSPNDLRIYVLAGAAGGKSWAWVRWLPHCRPGIGSGAADGPATAGATGERPASCLAQVGNNAETVATRVAELLEIIGRRQSAAWRRARRGKQARGEQSGDEQAWPPADIMVVLDGVQALSAVPGVTRLLREGPDVGVYAICVDTDERLLPAECQAVAVLGPDGLRLRQETAAPVTEGRPDRVMPGWCLRVARAIAPVRDVGADESAANGAADNADPLPGSVRLLEVLGLEAPAGDAGEPGLDRAATVTPVAMSAAIAERWRHGGRSTLATVGVSVDGPVEIDLKRYGPHGLVTGSAGSGKSELLRSLVASLAVANRPDEMVFVLIDGTGGDAFAECARLPHTVGMLTRLDPQLIGQTLVLLSAELARRERLLAQADASGYEDYQQIPAACGPGEAGASPEEVMPRLVIVIDELTALARELPDFTTRLAKIAQRGRSLGVHVIMSTGRPSASASSAIGGASGLRIALRLTDTGDSAAMIGQPDAARIGKDTPGRGYVRLGRASLVPFQAGLIGGPRQESGPAEGGRGDAAARRAVWLAPADWSEAGRRAPVPPATLRVLNSTSDLAVLVAEIRRAAWELSIPQRPGPWVPPQP